MTNSIGIGIGGQDTKIIQVRDGMAGDFAVLLVP